MDSDQAQGPMITREMDSPGYVIIAIFVASWLVSFVVYRVMGYDKIGV